MPDTKDISVLDQVKKVEKIKKIQLLAEVIADIKKLAKDILIAKEKTNYILEKMGFSEKEVKSVVDYINTLVKLTRTDKDALREKADESVEEKEASVEKKIKSSPIQFSGYAETISNFDITGSGGGYTTTNITNPDYKVAYMALNSINK